MLTLTVMVDSEDVMGVKETLAAYLERFGDVKVTEVKASAAQRQESFLDVDRAVEAARAFRDTYGGRRR